MTDKPFKDQIADALAENDPSLSRSDPDFMVQAILLASAYLGADERLIANGLEYDREFVDQVGHRLRNGGIWAGDVLDGARRDAWCAEGGGLDFIVDAQIGSGSMVVADPGPSGERRYYLTPSGLALAATLIKSVKKQEY